MTAQLGSATIPEDAAACCCSYRCDGEQEKRNDRKKKSLQTKTLASKRAFVPQRSERKAGAVLGMGPHPMAHLAPLHGLTIGLGFWIVKLRFFIARQQSKREAVAYPFVRTAGP
jgi:hypothetical protein